MPLPASWIVTEQTADWDWHQAATAGTLRKALNPELFSCIKEIKVSRSGFHLTNCINVNVLIKTMYYTYLQCRSLGCVCPKWLANPKQATNNAPLIVTIHVNKLISRKILTSSTLLQTAGCSMLLPCVWPLTSFDLLAFAIASGLKRSWTRILMACWIQKNGSIRQFKSEIEQGIIYFSPWASPGSHHVFEFWEGLPRPWLQPWNQDCCLMEIWTRSWLRFRHLMLVRA